MLKSLSKSVVTQATATELDREALQALINRRLALKLGTSLPVAAAIAALRGLGPQEARR